MTLIAYQEFNFTRARQALIDTANEIIGEYQADGYTLTLRQLYYQFVARGIIENTERSYKNLGTAVSDGRLAGIISWNAIEDRGRGINEWLIQEDAREVLSGIEYGYSLDYWERQEVYVEVWVEKEALASVIERPCNRFRVPYMACKGYLSASEAWRAGRRFRRHAHQGRRCVMIHLGDHDPSGIDMTRDNDDRLLMFSGGEEIEVRRIALNMDQVRQYRPPENPAKVTDSRASDYIARFGSKSWELDALEPRVLDRLVTEQFEGLIDPEIWRQTASEEDSGRQILSQLHERFDDVSDFLQRDEED